MAGSMYSVTLTGKVRGGRDAPAVWRRVAALLKLDEASFRERVLARIPVTLKAVDYEAARRQQEALTSGGAHALLLAEDDAPRVWIRDAKRTRGPLSMAYARHALREGQLSPDIPTCALGDQEWLTLEAVVEQYAPPTPAAVPERPASAGSRDGPQRHRGASGKLHAAIVMAASLALVAALALLVGWPAYRTAQARAAARHSLAWTAPARRAVAAFLRAHGRLPVDAAEAGLAPPLAPAGRDVTVTVDRGDVLLRFGTRSPARVRGRRVRFSPSWRGGAVTWHCSSPDLPQAALPAACR